MRRFWIGCLTFSLLAALVAAKPAKEQFEAKAHDWPQWRGPQRNALSSETGLLKDWSEKGPPLMWSAKGLGRGYSTVAVSEGRIFSMGDLEKNEEYVFAVEEATGKILWKAKLGEGWSDGGPRCTPTVDGDRLYALTPRGELVCLDTATGNEKWRKNLKKDFGGAMMSYWAYSESPLVDGEKLVCTPGGKEATLVALNKLTGETIWKSQVPEGDKAAYSSIVISEAAGVRQYVQLLQKGIVGVSAADGKFLWRYNKMANGTANIPTPLVKDDFVFCSTGYGAGSALLQIYKDGEAVKVKEVYFLPAKVLQNHHGGLVLVGDYIYGGHGHNAGDPICVELKTGKVMWKQNQVRGTRSAAVVFADGELYFRYEKGSMVLIDANPEGYKERGTFKIPTAGKGPSWPHPVVANGKLYIRDQDELLCFDVKKHN